MLCECFRSSWYCAIHIAKVDPLAFNVVSYLMTCWYPVEENPTSHPFQGYDINHTQSVKCDINAWLRNRTATNQITHQRTDWVAVFFFLLRVRAPIYMMWLKSVEILHCGGVSRRVVGSLVSCFSTLLRFCSSQARSEHHNGFVCGYWLVFHRCESMKPLVAGVVTWWWTELSWIKHGKTDCLRDIRATTLSFRFV